MKIRPHNPFGDGVLRCCVRCPAYEAFVGERVDSTGKPYAMCNALSVARETGHNEVCFPTALKNAQVKP